VLSEAEPGRYGVAVVFPDTLFDIDPDDTATPLVPPLVWLTLMPLELVVVPLVVILPLAKVSVEQLPLHAALARLFEYPVLSDTLPFATLWASAAPTGAGAVVAISSPTATHAIIDRFILGPPRRPHRTLRSGDLFCPTEGAGEHDYFASPCFRTEHR
jgi:hypothetical protein